MCYKNVLVHCCVKLILSCVGLDTQFIDLRAKTLKFKHNPHFSKLTESAFHSFAFYKPVILKPAEISSPANQVFNESTQHQLSINPLKSKFPHCTTKLEQL